MGLFKWLFSSTSISESDSVGMDDDADINPANGLPMIGGTGGMDIEGNAYGFDSDDSITGTDMFDSTSNMFDDDWM